jgi:hypothetical protein
MNEPYFVDIEIDSLKRGRPMVYGPTEFQADLIRDPIFCYGFIKEVKDGQEVIKSIFVTREKKKGEMQKFNQLDERIKKSKGKKPGNGARPGMGGPGMGGPGMGGPGMGGPGMGGPGMGGPGMGGMGGPGMGGKGGAGMGGPGMGGPGMGGPGLGGGSSYSKEVVRELVTVPIKEFVEGKANFTPAQFVRPMRAIVITASIPWKKQLEEFQKQLRYATLADLVANSTDQPQFKGFKVKRRVTAPDGRVGAWEDYDWQARYEPIFVEKILEDHQDPAELAPVIPSEETRLFVPLPKLVRGKYPDIRLSSIERTLNAIKNSNESNRVVPGGSKLEGKGDVFAKGGQGKAKDDGNKGTESSQKPQEAQEAFLMRFLDVDVLPGFGYEYQIQIRVANPNHGKRDKVSQPNHAKPEELESAPVLVTFKDGDKTSSVFRVPEERYVYAFAPEPKDQRVSLKPDHVRVQIQDWLPNVRIDRDNANATEPIGDWIVEDVQIPRGQFVIGTKPVKMPIWSPTKNAFVFMELGKAARPGTRSSKDKGTLPVDLSAPYLLVDFEGGQIRTNVARTHYVSDEAGTEILLLGEDGKLRVRSAWTDVADAKRAERDKEWLTWQRETKDGGSDAGAEKSNPFDKGGNPGK